MAKNPSIPADGFTFCGNTIERRRVQSRLHGLWPGTLRKDTRRQFDFKVQPAIMSRPGLRNQAKILPYPKERESTMAKTTRRAFHQLLNKSGIQYSTYNEDSFGTKLSESYTDIVVSHEDLAKLEALCSENKRACDWPCYSLYDNTKTVRRITLWK